MKGVDQNINFILSEDAVILNIKNGEIEESDIKLLKGTVLKGILKTRVLKLDNEKVPVKIIQLEGKKGYLSPSSVNLFVGDFSHLDSANKKNIDTPVKDTAFGENLSKSQKLKKKAMNFTVKYGLPALGGVVGYKIAKKTGVIENGKIVGYVLFFALIGSIPRFLRKNK